MPRRTCLPLEALVFLPNEPAGSRIGRARRYGDGLEPTDYDNRQWTDWEVQAYVRQLNEQRGVTEAAAACLRAGGLQGWDSPEFCELAGGGAFDHDDDDAQEAGGCA